MHEKGFGTWDSPITADAILAGTLVIDALIVDPLTHTVFHTEKKADGGYALIETSTGTRIGAGDVRSGVHEYGGGAAIVYNGSAYYSNYTDGRIHAHSKPITPESDVYRYADFNVHPLKQHWLVAVREDHTNDTPQTVVNELVVINTETSAVSVIVTGADFYSAPRFSPDGSKLAWQNWYHPDMPWEGAEIQYASVTASRDTFTLSDITYVAGEKLNVGVSYPLWLSNETLAFSSDKSGFSNLWVYDSQTGAQPILKQPFEEEFGYPAWRFGDYPYAALSATRLFTFAYRQGKSVLYVIHHDNGVITEIDSPYVSVSNFNSAGESSVVFYGQKSDGPGEIVQFTYDNNTPQFRTIKSTALPGAITFPTDVISIPEGITLRLPPNNEPLHIVYYAPKNAKYKGLPDEKPPCVINAHGGPTAMAKQVYQASIQYYTSRGWAWVDVNYGGSSGFGRSYISRLAGKWGLVDTSDCLSSAKALATAPYSLIDPKRTVIRGGSAGGYTVLGALSFGKENEYWAAATSLYGISDLRLLATFTHKFELRYMEKLMGGTVDAIPKTYDQDRSPLYHASKINSPLLILQGDQDKVVPPEQSQAIAKAIEKRGGRVKYVEYVGEGHGWKKDENIRHALTTEIGWYSEVLRLEHAA